MAIDFPASPTLNQTFTSGSTTWRWNGSSWVAVPQTITASGLGLGNVENTALSTWAGSSNLTTLGTVGTGTWNATNIGLSKGGTNASLTASNGGVVYSTASALAVLAPGTSGQVMLTNGSGAAPSWINYFPPIEAQGRITTQSGQGLSTTDRTAQTSLYYTPYTGNVISLYNTTTSSWENVTFTELSLSINAYTASTNYDVFVVRSGSSLLLYLNSWSTATARSVSPFTFSSVNGAYYLAGTGYNATRYVGTIRTTATTGQTEDSMGNRFVWNMYNQVPRPILRQDGTASWTYASTTYRNARGQVNDPNRLFFVIGQPISFVDCWIHADSSHATAGQGSIQVVTYDSTTVFTAMPGGVALAAYLYSQVASQRVRMVGRNFGWPDIGYHYLSWSERIISTGTATIYGAVDSTGLAGSILC